MQHADLATEETGASLLNDEVPHYLLDSKRVQARVLDPSTTSNRVGLIRL